MASIKRARQRIFISYLIIELAVIARAITYHIVITTKELRILKSFVTRVADSSIDVAAMIRSGRSPGKVLPRGVACTAIDGVRGINWTFGIPNADSSQSKVSLSKLIRPLVTSISDWNSFFRLRR